MKSAMKPLRIARIIILGALASVYLASCGSSHTSSIVVADTGNARVLIFNSPLRTDENASVVFGQPDFTSNQQGSVAANTLTLPNGFAEGPEGVLAVADYGLCRVLVFKPPFTTNMSAFVVIGKPDFTTSTCHGLDLATASSLYAPDAAAFDSNGNLWVADRNDSRVLEYPAPISNGEAAAVVIGQATTEASGGCNQGGGAGAPTAATLCGPSSISFDSHGNLWVTDEANERVLEFSPPFTTGMNATLELGQPGGAAAFTTSGSNNPSIVASSFGDPLSAVFDSQGNLWVTDFGDSRVLEFVPPFSSGMEASLVLGQTNFTSATTGTTASTFFGPAAVTFERNGDLVVSDFNNSRVLIFVPPFSTGMSATSVLGQADLTSGAANQGATREANTLKNPVGVLALH